MNGIDMECYSNIILYFLIIIIIFISSIYDIFVINIFLYNTYIIYNIMQIYSLEYPYIILIIRENKYSFID